MVFALSYGIQRVRPATAQVLFLIFAALIGLSSARSSWFRRILDREGVLYHSCVVRCLELWGDTTQRDLSGMGSFLIMGLFGVILASLVNLFMQSTMMQFIISVIGVRCSRVSPLGILNVLRPSISMAEWKAKPRNAPPSSAPCRST